ncbi:hypothetical protein TrVE_jg13938 [Triparma verrucosa]|uniref:Uncharacterized protein n=1 Tax=Triparma verrucosa TaxID=1606542 RepID=A0A9W7FN61_9STRA|nr:hypothetical protein TrVE_jg13938 [Triparma verrucosa]
MSVFTAAFTSTGISFDFDTDKFQRAINLDFYGYVPDGIKKKVQVFFAMFLISASKATETVHPPNNAGAIRRRTILADAKKLASEND